MDNDFIRVPRQELINLANHLEQSTLMLGPQKGGAAYWVRQWIEEEDYR